MRLSPLVLPPTTIKRKTWRRRIRYFYLRLMRLQSTPDQIGRGVAAGLFAGSLPLFGLQTLISITLALLLGGNRWVAIVSTWYSNPLTDLPIFWFNYQVGRWLVGSRMTHEINADALQNWMIWGWDFVATLLVGSVFVGSQLAIVGYFLSRWQIKKRRQQYRQRAV